MILYDSDWCFFGRLQLHSSPGRLRVRIKGYRVREKGNCLFGRYPCKEHDKQGNEEILHQLRLVVYPIIYKVLAPSQVVFADFFHQQYHPFQVSQRPAPSSRRIISISQSPVGMPRYRYIYIYPQECSER